MTISEIFLPLQCVLTNTPIFFLAEGVKTVVVFKVKTNSEYLSRKFNTNQSQKGQDYGQK